MVDRSARGAHTSALSSGAPMAVISSAMAHPKAPPRSFLGAVFCCVLIVFYSFFFCNKPLVQAALSH
jgi:hypothetical protein